MPTPEPLRSCADLLDGTARAVHEPDAEWADLLALFPPMLGARNLFVLDVGGQAGKVLVRPPSTTRLLPVT